VLKLDVLTPWPKAAQIKRRGPMRAKQGKTPWRRRRPQGMLAADGAMRPIAFA